MIRCAEWQLTAHMTERKFSEREELIALRRIAAAAAAGHLINVI